MKEDLKRVKAVLREKLGVSLDWKPRPLRQEGATNTGPYSGFTHVGGSWRFIMTCVR
jgi:hypothetical protein